MTSILVSLEGRCFSRVENEFSESHARFLFINTPIMAKTDCYLKLLVASPEHKNLATIYIYQYMFIFFFLFHQGW